jgi:hypothetical protein
MKNILLIACIGISSLSFSQIGMWNNSTWLYNFSKTETYSNEWNLPSSYLQGTAKYSIYYAKDGNWKFVGKILRTGEMMSAKVYFKSNYRVSYGKDDEKPTEIVFKTKQWKVE